MGSICFELGQIYSVLLIETCIFTKSLRGLCKMGFRSKNIGCMTRPCYFCQVGLRQNQLDKLSHNPFEWLTNNFYVFQPENFWPKFCQDAQKGIQEFIRSCKIVPRNSRNPKILIKSFKKNKNRPENERGFKIFV